MSFHRRTTCARERERKGLIMALDAAQLKSEMIKAMESTPDNRDEALGKLAETIVNHIKNNLEVVVPSGSFVTTVTGQAVGTSNLLAVDCDLK